MMTIPLHIMYNVKDTFHLYPLPKKTFWGYTVYTKYNNETYIASGASVKDAVRNLFQCMKVYGINASYASDTLIPNYTCSPGTPFKACVDNALVVQ